MLTPNSTAVHCVRLRLPDGTICDLPTKEVFGLRKAMRAAGALAGWLGVDEWESASRFVPLGVQRVRRDLLKAFPDVEPGECVVEVACPGEGPDAENGYEVVAKYMPGSKVPELLKNIRKEACEAGWREDAAHVRPKPRFASQDGDDDVLEPTTLDQIDVNYTFEDVD